MLEGRDQRVLVVDDDPMILELVTTRLELAGYVCRSARDGRAAISALREARPQAMILDINMPELDGFGVLRRMATMGLLPGVPVMVLTARHEAYDVSAAVQLGARDYLAKPFNDQVLLQRVARLLRPAPQRAGAAKPPASDTNLFL